MEHEGQGGSPALVCRPIGVVRSPYRDRIDAPHQATVSEGTEAGRPGDGELVLERDVIPAAALRDLEGFERIWVIYWLHRSDGWRPTVVPPRGPRVARGVLATRSPHRPNALGLTCVAVLGVDAEARVVRVRGLDMLEGTPIFDLKPYVPYADAFPDASAGWVDALDAATGRHSAPGPKKPRRQS